ncbi:hypothetical protein RSAG8_02978, partial [Rhizoctonia solani AG-8 WAC10335]
MLDELVAASDLLYAAALERYSVACSTIRKSCARGDKPHTVIHQLLLRMGTEVELAASLEVKLRQAKTAISWSMNRMLSNVHTTINSLPPEILSRIFHLVVTSQPCAKRDYRRIPEVAVPAYPIVLSHVCSRWREITLDSPTLWSHLDIATSQLLNRQRLHDRTELHLNQVGQLPLDPDIFKPLGYSVSNSHPSDFATLVELITRLASRTCSFQLDARSGYFHPVHSEILSYFLQGCVADRLTQLTLRRRHDELGDDGDGYGFLKSEDDRDAGGLEVGVSTRDLEDILSHVTVLRLEGLYPRWNSRAYHGLTELRLNGAEFRINESDLVGILRLSPCLCVFEFGLIIGNPIPINTQVSPIPLSSLETLNLMAMQCHQLPTLLRWLAPGPKPLQLALERLPEEELSLKDSSRLFFSRSHITRAYFIGPRLDDLLDFLELSPHLRVLVLRRLDPLGPPTSWNFRNINFVLCDPREPCPTAEWGMFAPDEEP